MSGFSDRERKRISEALLEEGRELFVQFGIERTRIADLTDAVGIGTSTFYRFYDSKEALYIEILERERQAFSERIDTALANAETIEAEVTIALEQLFQELEENPLYYRLVVENDLDTLHRGLSDTEVRTLYESEFAEYEPHARRWTESGSFRIDDPAVLFGVFRLVALTATAKERFENVSPTMSYEVVRDVFIATLVEGLFVDERR